MSHTIPKRTCGFALLFSALSMVILGGCNKTIDDATLTNNVKAALAADATINQQPVQVAVQSGVVTLSGNVSDSTAKSVAATDAAKVAGVKEVVTAMTVAGITVAPTVTSPAAPTVARHTTQQERQLIANNQPLPPPTQNIAPPPPQPSWRDVTVPAGTIIPIRITESLDSETTQPGTRFTGVVTHEVVADGMLAIPAGSAVSGRVIDAKDAGHFKRNSLLSIELTSIRREGEPITVATDAYTIAGKGRGTNTAEKVGGGAAIGAVLGGIFGGGKGAAIGAAAGGGGGAAVQGFTRGQQVTIPSETLIRFHLANPLTVRTSEEPSNYEPTTLQTR
jgi:hypothetical protein